MQISLESEAKGKSEALRIRKKLEQDINELEVALDVSNRGKAEVEKNVKSILVCFNFNLYMYIEFGIRFDPFHDIYNLFI
jgi:hypothetical protein